jgi:hypothetical protein
MTENKWKMIMKGLMFRCLDLTNDYIRSIVPDGVSKYLISVVDPFSPYAVGARIPALMPERTVCKTYRDTFTFSVTGGGFPTN